MRVFEDADLGQRSAAAGGERRDSLKNISERYLKTQGKVIVALRPDFVYTHV